MCLRISVFLLKELRTSSENKKRNIKQFLYVRFDFLRITIVLDMLNKKCFAFCNLVLKNGAFLLSANLEMYTLCCKCVVSCD